MSVDSKAKVYLIPVPIAENGFGALPAQNYEVTERLRFYVVEHARTARRILRQMHPELILEEILFSEIDKHEGPDEKLFRQWLKAGYEIGIMSEAGCPGVADPGSRLVALAHETGAQVMPLTGPSSILLALMASGMNGQSFAFEGYLPVKEPQRGQYIRQMEADSRRLQQTKIFIETPYRNNQLLADLLKHTAPETRLCIALHIGSPEENIRTLTLAKWKVEKPDLPKAPAVFLLLAGR